MVDTELGQLRLLAAASDLLTTTVDTGEALRGLAGLFVPLLADWAVVDVVTGPDRVSRHTLVHRDRPLDRLERQLPRLPARSDAPLARALRDGETVVIDRFDPPASADSDFHRAQLSLFADLGASHAAVVPLMAHGTPIGALTLVRTGRERPFTGPEITLAEGVARRTALAVDNARLYVQQSDTAAAFQRNLLPSLPQPDDLRLAARYVPAGQGRQIGGDWYDAFTARDGATVIVIGDVVGHDAHASARMAELRNLLRGCAWHAPPSPAAVLERLDDALRGLDVAAMASILCARIEQGRPGRLRWANAGHLPPLLVSPPDAAALVEGESGVILGAAEHVSFSDNLTDLPPGSKLLLYTDGLVEHRGDIADGLHNLLTAAADLAGAPLEDFCDGILDRLAPPNDDDIAVLAVEMPA